LGPLWITEAAELNRRPSVNLPILHSLTHGRVSKPPRLAEPTESDFDGLGMADYRCFDETFRIAPRANDPAWPNMLQVPSSRVQRLTRLTANHLASYPPAPNRRA
jgi:hypothetical protein